MRYSTWSILKRWLAGGAALATVGSAAYAGELFPYSPPPASATQQIQQPAAPPPAPPSADELRKIDALAREIAKLSPAQRKDVRDGVLDELNKAASRGDLQQIRYYSELLRRIDNAR
jgi:hypothetical protein